MCIRDRGVGADALARLLVGEADEVEPVSYTHLDVYKRQSFFCSLVTTAGYMYAGYLIGEPAVELMDVYGKYLWYVSIALIVGMIALAIWRSRRAPAA